MSSEISLEYYNATKAYSSAVNTTGGAISVILGGTAVPLANNQIVNNITVNGANTQFTVASAGTYLVSYAVHTTAALLLSSGVYVNGTATPSLTRSPGVSARDYSAQSIINLNAGDVLQLTLFGLLGLATLDGGAGAYMIIERLK